MKKSLIALAVLAASGATFAQSTVTIYGLLDANINSTKSSGVTNTKIDSGGLSTSRFGLRGSEDLGGGLKANFKLESGIFIDTGAARTTQNIAGASVPSLFNREAYVGLSGGFGEIKLGKMFTAYDDLQGLGTAAFNSFVFSPVVNVWQSNNYNFTPSNSIYYATPSFSGFSGAVSHSLGENKTTTTSAGSITSARIGYEGGPIAAGLSYQTEKATGALPTTKYTQINISYDLGVAKLLAAYGNVKDGTFPKTNEYQIGVDFPVSSALTVSAGLATSKSNGAPADTKSNGFALAAKYSMSKRTDLYAALQNAKTTGGGKPEDKSNVYALGVQHRF